EMVFNVDSFQGHEVPYVVVSAIRMMRSGFPSFESCMKVRPMRCRKRMVLDTQRTLIHGDKQHTLL
ncbi:hypothetical protein BD414DRAFT_380680, partial [Trametes punicea]